MPPVLRPALPVRVAPSVGSTPAPPAIRPAPGYVPAPGYSSVPGYSVPPPGYPSGGYSVPPPGYPSGYGYPDPYAGGTPYDPYGYGGYYPPAPPSYGYGYGYGYPSSYGGGFMGFLGSLLGNGPLDGELSPEEEYALRRFYHVLMHQR